MSTARITKKSRHRNGRVTRSATKKITDAFEHNRNSPLLRLPGEIRNRIYEYAYGGYFVGLGYFTRMPQIFEWSICFGGPATPAFGDLILQTNICSQIYDETRTLPYAKNTFMILVDGDGVADWITRMTKLWRDAIQIVSFGFPDSHSGFTAQIRGLQAVMNALNDCAGLTTIIIQQYTFAADRPKIEAFAKLRGVRCERIRS